MSKRGNSEGSIYEREKDGRWVGAVSLGWEGGKRKRKTVYGATQAEVIDKLDRLRSDIRQNLPVADERLTLEKFLKDWLAHVEPGENGDGPIRRSTYVGYEVMVRRHIIPGLGRTRLTKLSPRDVESFLREKRVKPDKNGKALSPRTVQLIRVVLRLALQQAVSWGLVSRNVVDLTRGPSVPQRKVNPLTAEQVRIFLDGVRGDRLEGLYVTAFSLGMRQSELLGLRWQDVDLERGTLNVAQTLERVKGGRKFNRPKSDRSNRTLVMPAVTLKALRAHRSHQNEERLGLGEEWEDHGLVFTSTRGTPLDHRNVLRTYQRHLERLGLPPQTFHDARHACASLLLAQGVPLRTIMEVLGHSQIGITANTYAHLSVELKRDAADRMDALFASG